MTTTLYYSLIYHFIDERGSNAISKDKNKLLDLHHHSILDDDCYYHKYKDNIVNITCKPIECYTYNNETYAISNLLKCYTHNNTIILNPYNDNDKIKIPDGKFYALNRYPGNKDLNEILVYMSDYNHKRWRYCSENKLDNNIFYDELISDEVLEDTYYGEGIMNA